MRASSQFLIHIEQNQLFQTFCYLDLKKEQQMLRLNQIEECYFGKSLRELKPEKEMEKEMPNIRPRFQNRKENIITKLLE